MKVSARIANVDWRNPLKPTCLVILTAPGKIVRILRMRIKDLPNFIFQKQEAL